MGSDSAPHPKHAKESACPCAGVYTTPHLLGYVADIFAELGVLNRLDGFIQDYGAAFYGETLLCRAHAQQQRLINGQPLIGKDKKHIISGRFN
jgi:dihydroorotase